MGTRRIVTGQRNGKAVFLMDGPPPLSRNFEATPGFAHAICWCTAEIEKVPLTTGEDPTVLLNEMVPQPGETRLMTVVLPPDSVFADPKWNPVAASEENEAHLLGMSRFFEPDAPGMHRTDTVDYGVVLEGEVWLELDDGVANCLKPGDVVIQGGVRHAWRNRTNRPVKLLFVLIGARRA